MIAISDADRSDARDRIQSRGELPDRPRAADFYQERYNPLARQLVQRRVTPASSKASRAADLIGLNPLIGHPLGTIQRLVPAL